MVNLVTEQDMANVYTSVEGVFFDCPHCRKTLSVNYIVRHGKCYRCDGAIHIHAEDAS